MPDDKKLDEFIQTGLVVSQVETNQDIMAEVLSKIETLITNKEFSKALQPIRDSLALPNWKETYGTHLILAEAYCMLNEETGFKDTIKIRENLF